MILISAGLVLAAVVLLIAGFVLALPFLIMWSIVVSVLSALFLVIGAFLRRNELFPGGGQAAAPATPSKGLMPPAQPYNQTGLVVQQQPRPPAPQRTAAPQTQAPRRPVASGIAPDAIVLVIPGRKRYHVPGCRQLIGRDHEELTHEEAREEGFTPCTTCLPDAVLGGRQSSAADPESAVSPGFTAANRAETSAETRGPRPPVTPPKPGTKASTPDPESASPEEGATGWFGRSPAASASKAPGSPSADTSEPSDDEQDETETSYFRPPHESPRTTSPSSASGERPSSGSASGERPSSAGSESGKGTAGGSSAGKAGTPGKPGRPTAASGATSASAGKPKPATTEDKPEAAEEKRAAAKGKLEAAKTVGGQPGSQSGERGAAAEAQAGARPGAKPGRPGADQPRRPDDEPAQSGGGKPGATTAGARPGAKTTRPGTDQPGSAQGDSKQGSGQQGSGQQGGSRGPDEHAGDHPNEHATTKSNNGHPPDGDRPGRGPKKQGGKGHR